jgi:WD40 repeat protein
MMAVKDERLYPRTESIVLKSPRRHYRIPVRSQHWQLRSLLSAEKSNIVYFPGGHGCNHIQRLNTTTHECETVRLLTFAPRCLVAKNGWLCCGSEHGEFVAIQLDDSNDNGDSSSSQTPGSDVAPGSSMLAFLLQTRRSNKSLVARSLKLAQDRVNCITLWFPPDSHASPMSYGEPVAVLANNDRTVTLVSLQDFNRGDDAKCLDAISYPDFVNRATISPDGRLLIAILDDPYLYVHERVEKVATSSSAAPAEPGYEWVQKQRLLLKDQIKDDRADSRGSFAACFSASGAFLAVGTQHGTISIFDATALTDLSVDPLITTFKSSRPKCGPGAIRDMAFSPSPFDILAWTEDRGHIGFADMRTNYIARQIVDINVEGDYEHINILDRNTIDPRLLESRNWRDHTPPVGGTATDSRRDDPSSVDVLNHPLTASETVVLEAMQGERRRRERAIQRGGADGLIRDNESAWASLASLRPVQPETEALRTRQRSSSVSRGLGDLLGNYRDQRERAQERMRNAHRAPRDAAERVQATRRPDQRWMERIGETVSAMRDRPESQDPSYLNMVEILQARERNNPDGEHEDAALLVPLFNQVVNRWEESAIRGTLGHDQGVHEVPPSPDNTAGLAWSEDGRTVFVGAQNGIYEFHINTYSRKLHSSVMIR